MVKEANADREDLVEAAVSQVEVLEGRDEELCPAGFDVRRIPAHGGLDHLGQTIDRCEMSRFEPLADERRRNSVPATNLEHHVVRPDIQLLDDRSQSLAHNTAVSRHGTDDQASVP